MAPYLYSAVSRKLLENVLFLVSLQQAPDSCYPLTFHKVQELPSLHFSISIMFKSVYLLFSVTNYFPPYNPFLKDKVSQSYHYSMAISTESDELHFHQSCHATYIIANYPRLLSFPSVICKFHLSGFIPRIAALSNQHIICASNSVTLYVE